ncbi:MAG: alpha/beta hydrolase [Pseudomonadota bacterium]|nr:alpha/beta hydrolase [Pseudomonadota bacterium]
MPEFLNADQNTISYDIAGDGPPLLLLHGFPQTRAMWRPIVPILKQTFTVVTADLRGYGDSFKPKTMPDMGFRPMGKDMLDLMDALSFDRFHLAGHDRGGRTAHRMALDAPDRIASLTVMDIVPTEHLLENITHHTARAYYHWFFLAQPAPFPETMIGHDPDMYFERCLIGFGKADMSDFDETLLEEYRRAWRDPAAITAMCNDYRAAIDVDLPLDTKDLSRTVDCPALVLYGADGAMAKAMDVGATWADRLSDMESAAIAGGHFFPDQSPDATAQAIASFCRSISV